MSYLADSDLIISGLNGRAEALGRFAALRMDGLAISSITLAEVLEGAYGSSDPGTAVATAVRFLGGFPVLDVTSAVADAFARSRSHLRQQGNVIPDMDLLIAATASSTASPWQPATPATSDEYLASGCYTPREFGTTAHSGQRRAGTTRSP